MKLIDAIKNVIRPETNRWQNSAPLDEICSSLGISRPWDESDELDEKLKSYPLFDWLCTDTHVGLYALYLGDKPVGCTMQTARKNSIEVRWLSNEAAEEVRTFILSCDKHSNVALIDPEEEVGVPNGVSYTSQLLTDDGFYQGRPVKVLVRYDRVGITTDPKYRRPGHSYCVAVGWDASEGNHLLVQDGDEQRLIPVKDFEIPLKVVDV